MSRAICQPVNQVRLTNVAVVKLRTHGKRFEIACYRNKVLNFREGSEMDLAEVLQTESVFTNVSKGQLAKKEELIKVFGTADQDTICRMILSKGELQIADKERSALLDTAFRDVCSVVASKLVNPRTGLPLTVTAVEAALRECGFAVRSGESSKKQALKAVEVLVNKLPDQVARAMMALAVTVTSTNEQAMKAFLEEECRAVIQKESRRHGLFNSRRGDLGGGRDGEETELGKMVDQAERDDDDDGDGDDSGASGDVEKVVIHFAVEPAAYRQVDHFVTSVLVPAGSLQVISSNVGARVTTTTTNVTGGSAVEAAAMSGGGCDGGNRMPLCGSLGGTTVVGLGRTYGGLESDDGGGNEARASAASGAAVGNGGGSVVVGNGSGSDEVAAADSCEVTGIGVAVPKGKECRTCGGADVGSIADYRKHCKSEWHGFNLKRRHKELNPEPRQGQSWHICGNVFGVGGIYKEAKKECDARCT